MLKLQADFGKKHELYTVKAISLREVFSEACAHANTIPKITQIYTAVHWSSCLICQMLIDTRIFICRVDPEHFSCESMFQSSLILKRQAVPEVKKKITQSGRATHFQNREIHRQWRVPVQSWRPFLPINTTVKIPIFCLFAQNTQCKFASLTFGIWFLDQVLFLLLLQVNIGILIAVTRVISRISADNYKVHGDANAFK